MSGCVSDSFVDSLHTSSSAVKQHVDSHNSNPLHMVRLARSKRTYCMNLGRARGSDDMKCNTIIPLVTVTMLLTSCFGDDTVKVPRYELCRRQCWREFNKCSRSCTFGKIHTNPHGRSKCYTKLKTCNDRCHKQMCKANGKRRNTGASCHDT